MSDPNENVSSLRGQLSQFQLVELVQAMGIGGTTGALHLTHVAGRRGVIYFEDGALTWSREHDSQALTLGAVLQQLNMVKAETIEDNYDRQVREPLGDLLGERLVETGAITANQLAEALRTQMLWTVREIALWDDGDYSFTQGEKPSQRTTTYPIETSRVGMEIIRYQHEWRDLHQWLPGGMHTKLRMTLEPPHEHPLLFSSPVWRAITRVNAFQTPRRIATALYRAEMDVARILAPLVNEALIVASPGEHSVGLPTVARTITSQSIDLFTLISRMEHYWRKRRTLIEQLVAITTFINWTMDALNDAWVRNHMPLATDSLETLLLREKCMSVLGHPLRIVQNHIDSDELAVFFRQVAATGTRQHSPTRTLLEAYDTLCNALRAVFVAINLRVDSLQDRTYYEASWTEMFGEFKQTLHR